MAIANDTSVHLFYALFFCEYKVARISDVYNRRLSSTYSTAANRNGYSSLKLRLSAIRTMKRV